MMQIVFRNALRLNALISKVLEEEANLSTAGGTFPGFADTSGTYAVAVLCSKCSVPAPVVFSILQPQ